MPNIQHTQHQNASGSGAVSVTMPFAVNAVLVSIKFHLSASDASAQNFVVTINSPSGAAYNTKLLSQDLANKTDVVALFDSDVTIRAGGSVVVTFPNAQAATWGLEGAYREERATN